MTRDRRLACRYAPGADDPLSRVRLRAGRELSVINVSSHGVFVEGHVRLLPGTHLDVHVMTTAGRVLVRSRVVRAFVCGVTADVVTYRGAMVFEQSIVISSGYALPEGPRLPIDAQGIAYPERAA